MERFVVEFHIEFRRKACGMVSNSTALDKHPLDDSVDSAVKILDFLAFFVFEALAESQKVVYCPWTDVVEKFKNYYVKFFTVAELHRGVLASLGVNDFFIQAVASHLLPIGEWFGITLFVVDQGPISEVVPVADVLFVIKYNERAVLVVIKATL